MLGLAIPEGDDGGWPGCSSSAWRRLGRVRRRRGKFPTCTSSDTGIAILTAQWGQKKKINGEDGECGNEITGLGRIREACAAWAARRETVRQGAVNLSAAWTHNPSRELDRRASPSSPIPVGRRHRTRARGHCPTAAARRAKSFEGLRTKRVYTLAAGAVFEDSPRMRGCCRCSTGAAPGTARRARRLITTEEGQPITTTIRSTDPAAACAISSADRRGGSIHARQRRQRAHPRSHRWATRRSRRSTAASRFAMQPAMERALVSMVVPRVTASSSMDPDAPRRRQSQCGPAGRLEQYCETWAATRRTLTGNPPVWERDVAGRQTLPDTRSAPFMATSRPRTRPGSCVPYANVVAAARATGHPGYASAGACGIARRSSRDGRLVRSLGE